MQEDRRRFMGRIGIAFASLATLGCGPLDIVRRLRSTPVITCYVAPPPTQTVVATCYTMVPATPTPAQTPMVTCYEAMSLETPTVGPGGYTFASPAWDEVRLLWRGFDRLAKEAGDSEKGEALLDEMTARHQALLETLVNIGELDPAVSDEMQTAFSEAAWHVWRSNAPITCYVPAPYPDYAVEGRDDLVRQADVLEEMAARSEIDEQTLVLAREAIARDMAYFMLTDEAQMLLAQQVVAESGEDSRQWPALAELELTVPEECTKAARLLAALLFDRGQGNTASGSVNSG